MLSYITMLMLAILIVLGLDSLLTSKLQPSLTMKSVWTSIPCCWTSDGLTSRKPR